MAESPQHSTPPARPASPASVAVRPSAWAWLLLALALGCPVLVVTGALGPDHRLDGAALAAMALLLVVAGAVACPPLLRGAAAIRTAELRAELEPRLAEQREQLRWVLGVLPLLLPSNEQAHLRNLAEGHTKSYRNSYTLRAELRRLRSVELLAMTGRIEAFGELPEEFDLADYVRLTPAGSEWVVRLRAIDAGDAADAEPDRP